MIIDIAGARDIGVGKHNPAWLDVYTTGMVFFTVCDTYARTLEYAKFESDYSRHDPEPVRAHRDHLIDQWGV